MKYRRWHGVTLWMAIGLTIAGLAFVTAFGRA
jgi:hypothetical protein